MGYYRSDSQRRDAASVTLVFNNHREQDDGVASASRRLYLDNVRVEALRDDGGPEGDIPEPATMALLGLAACGLGGYVRRRCKA